MGRPESKLDMRSETGPVGGFVVLDGEPHYRIAGYHRMEPFLVSLATDTDLWMFLATGGGLTAGRVEAEGALFPYRTVDLLHDAHHHTGPLTLIRFADEAGETVTWEPFRHDTDDGDILERNLYKNAVGNRLVFEEVHPSGLAFRYAWEGCDAFGWVRTARLENRGSRALRIDLLDGLRNVLPWGAPLALYQQSSNLVDAYKKSEIDPGSGIGIFSLTAGITDRAEAKEVLRANTVWCCGLEGHRAHLSPATVEAFRQGRVTPGGAVLNGARGNYFVTSTVDVEPGAAAQWRLVADAGLDQGRIAGLRRRIAAGENLEAAIAESLRDATEDLRRIVASADGLQMTGRAEAWSHHFSNVLFNNMRGGVFDRNHELPVGDLIDFLEVRDRRTAERLRPTLAELPGHVTVNSLRAVAHGTGDADFERLCHEYLPLYFGRRHGDPSRPWNRFQIKVRDADGARALHYAGNWRDIFQNWEALCTSFPDFLPNVVAKFVNASTVDGFNPYRITRDGVDWEEITPEDPWSNIGYWGDHQIIYLLKLLEALEDHDPGALGGLLGSAIFSYADVPYRIKPYREIVRNFRETIDFDDERAALVEERVAKRGSDGRLVTDENGEVYHANLFEKLLVPALSKLSNRIPGAGIWMNTQRPEWNDANNALGGGGVSVVTLCYLRRYLAFLADLLEDRGERNLPVSREVADWFTAIESALTAERPDSATSPRERRRMMDTLGNAFTEYRETVYANGFGGTTRLPLHRAVGLCRLAVELIDRDIAANRRDDGLFHTYNLPDFTADGTGVEVERLQEMLEGQVAVLSAGVLDPAASLDVLDALFASDLYCERRRSFMLYPERELPGFMERNIVPAGAAEKVPLLEAMLGEEDGRIVARDADGVVRFQGDISNGADLALALKDLGRDPRWKVAVTRDRAAVLALYEDVFDHDSYTGRSGVMYAFEGLGCIYWHMVAKLLLAVQENVLRAEEEGVAPEVQQRLAAMYMKVRGGIGYEKTAAEYGAFPMDPYSHTPPEGGAKQPGMTGQVKEEILTRLGELGVRAEAGALRFQPDLLCPSEFLAEPAEFQYFDLEGAERTLALKAGSLAFTYCQVPVEYRRVEGKAWIKVEFADGTEAEFAGSVLDGSVATEIQGRTGRVTKVTAGVPGHTLCPEMKN